MQKYLVNKILTIGIFALFALSTITPMAFGSKIKVKSSFKNLSTICEGKTLYVGGSGEGNYTKIQDAVDNASDGDTIYVYNGAYTDWVWIDKSISLIGEDKNNTIIEGGWGINVVIRAENVLVTGFNINNCGFFYSGGIHLSNRGGNCTIIDNLFTNNIVYGVSIESDYNTVKNNIFMDNYRGIKVLGANYNTISGNIIDSNNESGVYFPHIRRLGNSQIHISSNNVIKNNIITNNSDGIYLQQVNNTFISNNVFGYNKNGIESFSFEHSSKKNTWIENNTFLCNKWGIVLYKTYKTTIAYNIIAFNNRGVHISDCNQTLFYHNNFNSNTKQSIDDTDYCSGCINQWDNSYPDGGNFWSRFNGSDNYNGPEQDIPGSDGIGDTPYNISGSAESQDRYPLISPWNNTPPNAPIINGTTNGKVGVDYNFTFFTTDPEDEYIWYYICWGDKEIIYRYGPYNSGEKITLSYNWSSKGTYPITCWVRDIDGEESDIVIFEVTMPRNKIMTKIFFKMFLERFPNAFPLLRRILG
jgi:parallel beta-helix repeat protein